jgi:hypothetical protein
LTTLPLGVGAFKRAYAQMPEIKLLNRFIEKTPTNLKEQTALLTRPGTKLLERFPADTSTGKIRGVYSSPGIFNSDLFVVSGKNFYRYDGTTIRQIAGQVLGSGAPRVGFVKGAGYEHLFIADSLLLNYYGGGTHATGVLTDDGGTAATGTLTGDGTVVSDTETVTIGLKVYTFQTTLTNVDGHVKIVAGNAAATLTNLFHAINATGGVPGTDYALATTANTLVTATNPTATTVVATAIAKGTVGNAIATTETSTHLSWGAATLAGGTQAVYTAAVLDIGGTYYSWNAVVDSGAPAGTPGHPFLCLPGATAAISLQNMANMLNFVGTPGVDFSSVLTTANLNVSAVAGPLTLTVTARSDKADGNLIVSTVTGDAHLSWGAATLSGGGTDAMHGVPIPDGAGVSLVAVLNSFVWVGLNNSQRFYYVRPGEISIDPLDFASKTSSPDPLAELVRVGDTMLVMGTASTEFWSATGDNDNPFAPVLGRTLSRGCVPGTAVMIDERTVVLVGNDGRVYSVSGSPTPVSTHGIEERIRVQLRREAGIT